MNVPKLRFKEFNDEWVETKLGQSTTFKQGIQVDVENQFSEPFINSVRFIRIVDYTQNTKDKRYIVKPKKANFVDEHDVVLVRYGATAGFVGHGINGAIANNMFTITPNNNIDKDFLYTILKQEKIYKKLNSSNGSSAMPALNFGSVSILKFKYPSISEQKKIYSFMSLLDKKIELQTKKIEDLKLFKLSKYISVFSKINNKIKLSDICIIEKGKQINSDLLIEKGNYYMLNGGILPSGYLNEYNTNENTITISEGGNSCGYVNFNKTKFWCGGHCYKIISPFVNTSYLYHLLKYNEKKIMDLRVGSGLPNIQKKDLEALKLSINKNDEQLKIGILFDTFDKKINLETNKLNKFKELKKGLMQSMFV